MWRTLLVPILILFVFSKIVLNINMLTSIKKLREFIIPSFHRLDTVFSEAENSKPGLKVRTRSNSSLV